MKKPGFNAKGISELRTMAKKAGIIAKRTWKKEDFVTAISEKTSPKKTGGKERAIKATTSKTPAKKSAPSKNVKKKAAAKKAGPAGKPPAKSKTASKTASKATMKPVVKIKTKTGKQTLKKNAVKQKGKAAVKAAKKINIKRVSKEAVIKPSKKAAVITRAGETVKKVTIITRKPARTLKKAEYFPAPAGQDKNKIVLMPVTPKRIYVYWEITGPAVSTHKGSLNLKITGAPMNVSFYVPISERIGEHFINVSPGRGYTIEIGVINLEGKFVTISQSQVVTTPVATLHTSGSPYISGSDEPAANAETAKEAAKETDRLPDEFFELPESVSQY